MCCITELKTYVFILKSNKDRGSRNQLGIESMRYLKVNIVDKEKSANVREDWLGHEIPFSTGSGY